MKKRRTKTTTITDVTIDIYGNAIRKKVTRGVKFYHVHITMPGKV